MPAESPKINQIKGLVSHGLTVSEAVQKALDISLSEFARQHGFRSGEVSMCLLGYHQRTYPEIREAIAAALDVPREFIDQLIDDERSTEAVNQ